MASIFTSCPYDPLTLEGLSDQQLLTKRAKNQQMGLFMLVLVLLAVGIAFVLESYMVAVTSWALIPALEEYRKKRMAINSQLHKQEID
jgi:hypothetical protein